VLGDITVDSCGNIRQTRSAVAANRGIGLEAPLLSKVLCV
jgi:hypothetical protein